ncbi:MAG: hydrolase [Eggerthellaceae bacterium]|nr:hydrolase [Eggerthellaceae bacterium]
MGSRTDRAKKHARIMWRYLAAHLPRPTAGGMRVMDSATSSMLFLLGLAMLAFACAFACPAWASEPTATGEVSSQSEAAVQNETAADNVVNQRQVADNSFLYDTSIYELTQADTTYQGKTVQVVGEVVGESIRSQEDNSKVWITLEEIESSHESSISVLIGKDNLALIDTYGGYNKTGTTLQVRGTFYLACPSHEGIFDIHADSVTLVARGSVSKDEFRINDFIPGLVLVLIGSGLAMIYLFLRERER